MTVLSEVLQQLLSNESLVRDRTRRQVIVEVLDVDPKLAELWMRGTSLPSPDQLRMLVDFVCQFPELAETGFFDLFERPLSEITQIPSDKRLGLYMLSPQYENMIKRLQRLPWQEQELLLLKFHEEIRESVQKLKDE